MLNVPVPGLEVYLVPLQRHDFRDPETMPVSRENQVGVAPPVPPAPPCGLQERSYLGRREVLAGPQLGVLWSYGHYPAHAAVGEWVLVGANLLISRAVGFPECP
jgi:hypothetical protein